MCTLHINEYLLTENIFSLIYFSLNVIVQLDPKFGSGSVFIRLQLVLIP